jgi:hypothetical protein
VPVSTAFVARFLELLAQCRSSRFGDFSLQDTKMCDQDDCLAERSSLALALQAYRTLPKFPAGLESHREGKL